MLVNNKIRSTEIVTVSYQIIMLFIITFNYDAIPYNNYFIIYHIAISLILLYMHRIPKTKWLDWFKVGNPVILIPINFSELHYLVHNVNPSDFDNLLIRIDYNLFGVNPTIWMEKITTPLLTEYLQLVYSTFYFLPLVLFYFLYRYKKLEEFNYSLFIMVLGFYLSYLGYFLVPAVGPRFTLNHLQTFQLEGIWTADTIRFVLDSLENIQRDAFPSGHTAMTLLTMYYAYKYARKYFYVLLVIGSSMIFSTVYLRYHYVIDVVAGALLAIFVIKTGPWIYALVEKVKERNYDFEKIYK
ncbi:MAG: phosphatase PAP2 family protein [Calditrichaceae bacterium]